MVRFANLVKSAIFLLFFETISKRASIKPVNERAPTPAAKPANGNSMKNYQNVSRATDDKSDPWSATPAASTMLLQVKTVVHSPRSTRMFDEQQETSTSNKSKKSSRSPSPNKSTPENSSATSHNGPHAFLNSLLTETFWVLATWTESEPGHGNTVAVKNANPLTNFFPLTNGAPGQLPVLNVKSGFNHHMSELNKNRADNNATATWNPPVLDITFQTIHGFRSNMRTIFYMARTKIIL